MVSLFVLKGGRGLQDRTYIYIENKKGALFMTRLLFCCVWNGFRCLPLYRKHAWGDV